MPEQEFNLLDQLKKFVIQQKTTEFPSDTGGDADLDTAQIRLRQYDQFVSQVVIQVIQGEEAQFFPVQMDPDLDSELSCLHDVKPEGIQKIVERYLIYKNRLDRMLELAAKISEARK